MSRLWVYAWAWKNDWKRRTVCRFLCTKQSGYWEQCFPTQVHSWSNVEIVCSCNRKSDQPCVYIWEYKEELNAASDHHMVLATLKLYLKHCKPPTNATRARWTCWVTRREQTRLRSTTPISTTAERSIHRSKRKLAQEMNEWMTL